MSTNSPQIIYTGCAGIISTPFVYATVQAQNAANSVFFAKSTIDAGYAASNAEAPKAYTFKTDYERMQYILGRQALTRPN